MHRHNPEKKLLILRYFSRLLFYLRNRSDLEKHFIEKLNAKSFLKTFKKILKTDDVSALLYFPTLTPTH